MHQRDSTLVLRLWPCLLSRYLPVYLAHMIILLETHPETNTLLVNDDFGVMPVDQTTEQSPNRITRTKGGTVGFSLRIGASQRWMITAHSCASSVNK